MRRIAIKNESGPEVIVRMMWRQWQDGSWVAWLTDDGGNSRQLVNSRNGLEGFLRQARDRAYGSDADEGGSASG